MDKDLLLALNTQGFIPGPDENLTSFTKRVSLTKELFENPKFFFEKKNKPVPFSLIHRLKLPDYNWAVASCLSLFDISGRYFSAYFDSKKLKLFQGAATWIIDIEKSSVPILQISKKLKKGSFLRLYQLDDVLAHEIIHFARAGFNEPKYEEFFAYFTSSKIFRKILGPIAISSFEIMLFLSFLFLGLGFQYLGLLFESKVFDIFFIFFSYLSTKMIFLGFVRLFHKRWIFRKCYKKLFFILQNKKKTLSTMVRLTDREIKLFSKSKKDKILAYIEENREKSLRWKVISMAYFDQD